MKAHRGARWISAALGAAMLWGGATAQPVGAAGPILTVQVYIGYPCLLGQMAPSTELTLVLRRADGSLKDTITPKSDPSGLIDACFAFPIVGGNRLRATVGSSHRTIEVPNLKITGLDRVTDIIKAVGPANKGVRFTIYRCPIDGGIGDGCPVKLTRIRTIGSNGKITLDLSSRLDLRGRDVVDLIRRSPDGDRFVVLRSLPLFHVELGSPEVDAVIPVGSTVTYKLLDADGTLRGKATLTGGSADTAGGFGLGMFKHNGSLVNVEIGDRIVGSSPSDGTLTVRDAEIEVDIDLDTVSGRCYNGQRFHVFVPAGVPFDADATAGPDGRWQLDTNPPSDLSFDDGATVTCQTRAGDEIKIVGGGAP